MNRKEWDHAKTIANIQQLEGAVALEGI